MFHDVTLHDKFDLSRSRIFASGVQAVVRMLLMQRELDRRNGLETAGFVSGYRGSPLGGLDQQLHRARKELAVADIRFEPGVNEELAATAVWGTQQVGLYGENTVDGVFGMWYGKGPGVDRSGDVFRHANLAGTARNGGVLALMGDDHTAESSTNAHQTEFNFVDAMIPILHPAGVQEIIDYGLYGYALSRFAGTWVAFKCVKDNIESTASVEASLDRIDIVTPDHDMPPGGLNIRTELDFIAQEARLHEHKRDAVISFVRENGLNRTVWNGGDTPRLGIISVGKSYLDVLEALREIGVDRDRARALGIRLHKIAVPWPMDPREIMEFASGLETVVVVEEKRGLIEVQMKEELYGTSVQPTLIGKRDERGEWLFPVKGALEPRQVAIAVGERLSRMHGGLEDIDAAVKRLRQTGARHEDTVEVAKRVPTFCAGCPHNSSTKVPEGSRAGAGIGCHYMALWMDRETAGFTQMGGEGANWIGEAPFVSRDHLFQNLGDGTFNHSGSLAIRAAVSAGVNVTYKILFNDAVAMTGGQAHEGGLTPQKIAALVRAEGVTRIDVVTDEPEKYDGAEPFPTGVTVSHRRDLMDVQRSLREVPGVSVMIYDQTCAAEKRRRRKRGTFPDPDRRVIINELVCEGCGDCGVKSNCVAVQPIETEFGRKRRIDQSACNKDFSCLEGFCPSFVTVHGAQPKKAEARVDGEAAWPTLPEPELPPIDRTGHATIVTGIGGTGVVTIGAILGMAAHLEGKGCGMIDMAGLAQKGGAVFSHVRIAPTPADVAAIRVGAGRADLVLGCDLVVSGARKVLEAIRENGTLVVANTAEVMPGDFARRPDYALPVDELKREITTAAGEDFVSFFDATRAAEALFANTIAANMFMLGYAWQLGGVPLSREALVKAIELNGQSVEMNASAFEWGRRAAHDSDAVSKLIDGGVEPLDDRQLSETTDEVIERRAAFLTAYQSRRYARDFERRIAAIREAEQRVAPHSTALTEAAARGLFKLMAIKDEYEVGRLYTDGSFQKQLEGQFASWDRLEFHLAPPAIARKDADGHPVKRAFGPSMMRNFRALAKMRKLRGTPVDPFRYTAERRMERRLLDEYRTTLEEIVANLHDANHARAIELAAWPQMVRGYGHVKERHVEVMIPEREVLEKRFREGRTSPVGIVEPAE